LPLDATWTVVDAYATVEGSYEFIATIEVPDGYANPDELTASANIVIGPKAEEPVVPEPEDVAITGFKPIADINGGTEDDPEYADLASALAALPATVTATLDNGAELTLDATWAVVDAYAATEGTHAFKATVTAPEGYANPDSLTASANIVIGPKAEEPVIPEPEDIAITGFKPIADINGGSSNSPAYATLADAIAALPATVTAELANGEEIELPATWTASGDYKTAAGKYAFVGAVIAPQGYSNPDSLTASAAIAISASSITIVPPPYNPPIFYNPPAVSPTVTPVPRVIVELPPVSPEREPEVYAAQELYKLSLFVGTGTTPQGAPVFELERGMSRIEALAIVIRLMGLEDKALSFSGTNPFTDVPEWGTKYAGFAYSIGLAAGVNEAHTLFDSSKPVTAQQFTAFMLRVLGYYELNGDFAHSNSVTKGAEAGIILESRKPAPTSELARGEAVVIMARTLMAYQRSTYIRFIETLVSSGKITKDEASEFLAAIAALK
ncbi:MAG: Ig-like domain-containing protein, partial [Clostridiales bacterium]|nr:Ig-like domain-containing protein [Clostridiales bacterium]